MEVEVCVLRWRCGGRGGDEERTTYIKPSFVNKKRRVET
jgi:hypothetical protein